MANGLLDWADKQSDWVRDALRRHAVRPGFVVEADDTAAIASRIRHKVGFVQDEVLDYAAIAADHLQSELKKEPRAVLCSLGPVKNLNRLAEGPSMRFALDGITLVYGDNGSGKSGYCRITKKLCRSLTMDELLGNVFEAGLKLPAQVHVRYLEDGQDEPTLVEWIDGTPPPAPISRISVFDSANARLYVDKQNRIGFLPNEIALLERHGLHRAELETLFRNEIKLLDARLKVPPPAGYAAKGEVALIIAGLDPKSKGPLPTKADVEKLADFGEADDALLAELERTLASDPSTVAAKRRRAKAVLQKFAVSARDVERLLSGDAARAYLEAKRNAASTAEAATLAASSTFEGLPLPDVGLPAWRLMYDYARKYAATITGEGHDHLGLNEGDTCLLCQQPLDSDAARRMVSFENFVAGAANKAADLAEARLKGLALELTALDISTPDAIALMLGEYADLSAQRKAAVAPIQAFFEAAKHLKSALVASKPKTIFETLPPLGVSITAELDVEFEALEAEALIEDQAAADDGNRAADRARRDNLKDRKKLKDDLPIVLARLLDVQERAKLLECCNEVETGSVSRIMTSLRRSLVMEKLEARILTEIEALGLSHIPFAVNDRSQDGQSYFEVALHGVRATANHRVLSEGEQRALALACFLAEVGGDETRHGMIIDDPVSSLDHLRIRKVAKRLVDEAAKGRQVIIFTHNLLFFNEVVDAAAQNSPAVPIIRNYISKSAAAGFGLISETEEPWIAQAVTKRVETLRTRLKGFNAVADFSDEPWRRIAKDFYTDLRETWERLVEEVLLGKVVERFNTDVRTQSLRGVVISDDDHKEVYWAMKRVSERSGHDMAPGRAIPVPTPTEMKLDLETIEQFRANANKRKKDAEARRGELEKPPKASVL
jgi:hypothetical protein